MKNTYPKVICIGGVPMTGKSTAARTIASHLRYDCISTDDLCEAVSAVTDIQSHPAFHYMGALDYREYYITTDRKKLARDINALHDALWPALQQLIQNHSSWGSPIIIEGWALRPDRISRLTDNLTGIFLLADDDLIESRTRNCDFSQGASNKELMHRNYLERSLWFNACLRDEATRHHQKTLVVSNDWPEDVLADRIMECL